MDKKCTVLNWRFLSLSPSISLTVLLYCSAELSRLAGLAEEGEVEGTDRLVCRGDWNIEVGCHDDELNSKSISTLILLKGEW